MKKTILTVISVCVLALSVSAQEILTQGVLQMEISDAHSDDEQAAMGIQMLKGSKMTFVFNKDKYKTTMDMMGGMIKMDNVVDINTQKVDMIMEAMGNKMWVDTNLDEVTEGKKVDTEQLDIQYDKKDTKEIMGYKTYKFSYEGGAGETKTKIVGYLTDQIKTQGTMVQGLEELKLPGTPLEVTVEAKAMTMTISTVSIDKSLPSDAFKLNTEGCKKMTMEEFKKMGGNGMGMGF